MIQPLGYEEVWTKHRMTQSIVRKGFTCCSSSWNPRWIHPRDDPEQKPDDIEEDCSYTQLEFKPTWRKNSWESTLLSVGVVCHLGYLLKSGPASQILFYTSSSMNNVAICILSLTTPYKRTKTFLFFRKQVYKDVSLEEKCDSTSVLLIYFMPRQCFPSVYFFFISFYKIFPFILWLLQCSDFLSAESKPKMLRFSYWDAYEDGHLPEWQTGWLHQGFESPGHSP